MSKEMKLCMIGAGNHALRNIYPCFNKLQDAVITANADIDLEKAKKLAFMFGIKNSYLDYHEMLEAEKPDGVLICVGPDFHAKTAVELMRLGYCVYTEKPPAIDENQAKEVLEVCRSTGKICMTGFKKRFAPAYIKTKEIIRSGTFGEPSVISILRTSGKYKNSEDPRSQYLLDSGIHVIDLAVFLYGRVAKVNAFKMNPANYAITLEFKNNAVGTLTLTDRMSYKRGWEKVAVIGSEGVCIEIDNSVEMIAFQKDLPFAAHKPEFVAGSSSSSIEMGFVGELQAFINALKTGETPESGIEEAVHTMEVISAIEKSVRQNAIITIE